jgi:hypothetical protein
MIVVDQSTMIRDGSVCCWLLNVERSNDGIRFDYCRSRPLNLHTQKTLLTPPKFAIIDTVHPSGCIPMIMILFTRHNYRKFPMVKAVVRDRPLYACHC